MSSPPGPSDLRLADIARPVRMDATIGGLSTYYEIHRAHAYSRLQSFIPAEGAVVVDVGANVGMYSMWAAGRLGGSGRLVAIEPHPAAFALLQQNVSRWDCSVDPVNVACSAVAGNAQLRFRPGELSTASLEPGPHATESVTVKVRTLDEVLGSEDVREVSVIKIDVEGWEAQVLRGARQTLRRTSRVVLECEDRSWPEVRELLAEAGLIEVHRLQGVWGRLDLAVVYAERQPVAAGPGRDPGGRADGRDE